MFTLVLGFVVFVAYAEDRERKKKAVSFEPFQWSSYVFQA